MKIVTTIAPVLGQNLNRDVSMESAEDWYRCYEAKLLRAPKRRSLAQCEMGPDMVVPSSNTTS